MQSPEPGIVVQVSVSPTHTLEKSARSSIELIEGEGVVGDAHRGRLVKHRSRVAADPSQPNLRQVHLIHCELFDELAAQGFTVTPGRMGPRCVDTLLAMVSLLVVELRTTDGMT